MQPYMLGFCEQKPTGITRSVLTAVARVGPNKTLFASCKHVVSQLKGLFMVSEQGVISQATWGLIPTITPDLDLSFFFIREDVPSNRIKINEAPIGRDTFLTHARNRFGQVETPSPFTTHSVSTRNAPFRAEFGWSIEDNDMRYRFLREEGEFKEAKSAGVRTLYRVLEMESWPGVSGSALWDKFGSIRGMVCGGDNTETRGEDGVPHLIYLPAKTIAKEVALVLKHPDFRARMAS